MSPISNSSFRFLICLTLLNSYLVYWLSDVFYTLVTKDLYVVVVFY